MADNIVNSLMNEKVIDGTVSQMLSVSVDTATILAGAFILIAFSWSYIKNSIDSFTPGKEGKLFDPMELGRILGLVFIITSFTYIADPMLEGIASINRSFKAGTEEYQAMKDARYSAEERKERKIHRSLIEILNETEDPAQKKKVFDRLDDKTKMLTLKYLSDEEKQVLLNETEEASWSDSLKYLQNIYLMFSNPINIITLALSGLASLISGLIKLIVTIGAFYVLKILIILGPLAFAVSILPAFRDQYLTWLQYTLNTAFVFLILNLIDNIAGMNGMYALIGEHLSESGGDNSISGIQNQIIDSTKFSASMMAFDFMLIALYASSFKLTAVFIGKGFAGGIVGKAAGAATVVAGALAGAAMMGASAASGASASGASGGSAGGGGSTGGNIVNTAVDSAKSVLNNVDDQ